MTGESAYQSSGSPAGPAPDIQTLGLKSIAAGINLALTELDDLTVGKGWSGSGRGFSELALSGVEASSPELRKKFADFCERWEWGVRALIQEGNELAEGVGLAAGTLHQTEEYVEGTFKVVTNAGIGDPSLSEEQAAGMSWSQHAGNNYFTNPDWSGDAFKDGYDEYRDLARDPLAAPEETEDSGGQIHRRAGEQ